MRPHLFELRGRVAIVTGGLGRLGPVWGQALRSAGAVVVLVDLPGAEPTPLARALLCDDAGVLELRADVTDRAGLESVLEECRRAFGVPDVLVNNAGIDQPPTVTTSYALEDLPLEDFRRPVDVNAAGTFLASQVFGGEMVRQGRGAIVNIGSLYASHAPDARVYEHLPMDPPFLKPPGYGASKSAVVNITRYFAAHWAGCGVRVNALSPGGVAGEQDPEFVRKFCARVPMGRLATSDDLVGPLLFLASDAAAYVTGINLEVDGGYGVW